MTARDLITASLRLIGAIAPGESMEAAEATDGLAALNMLVDSLSAAGQMVNAVTTESAITLTPGDATYTLGTSGDITTRPMSIVAALIRDGSNDYPVKIITAEEYAAKGDKSAQVTYPEALYDDGAYPTRTITLYPTPASAKSLILYTSRPLTQIATLDTSISLPQGYERMLKYNLAIDLAPEYGKTVSQEIAAIAMQTRDDLERQNVRVPKSRADEALLQFAGAFDFTRGE